MTSDFTYSGTELDDAALATNWKSYFRSRIGRYITGRVLEVGAGLGGTTIRLRDGRQTDWLCLEPDAALAARLESTLHSNPSTVPTRVVIGGLEALGEREQFDCILYIDVLEHIEDDVGELKRAAGHLAPGGTLVVLCPAFQVLFSEMDHALGHFRRYTKRTIAPVFPASTERVELFYLDSLGMLASLANKLFLRQAAPNEGQVRFWDSRVIPVSRVLDPILLNSIGRSVVAIYRNRLPDRSRND
jgi:SAM-dependent methyltransferase